MGKLLVDNDPEVRPLEKCNKARLIKVIKNMDEALDDAHRIIGERDRTIIEIQEANEARVNELAESCKELRSKEEMMRWDRDFWRQAAYLFEEQLHAFMGREATK